VSRSAVYEWLQDPDNTQGRRRKAAYREARRCPECGERPAGGYDGPDGPETRCRVCSNSARAKWTPDTVCAALREFFDRYGRIPTSTDLNHALATRRGPDAVARFNAIGLSASTVRHVYGSFRAGTADAFTAEEIASSPRPARGGAARRPA
jgi:hypothetical protein